METWRIEKMIPVKQEDPLCNGKLYQGDSYIFLSTTMKGSAIVWHIHFWLGEETSQVRTPFFLPANYYNPTFSFLFLEWFHSFVSPC